MIGLASSALCWADMIPPQVSHDVLMLVDGTRNDILVGNVHLGRLEAILG